MFENKEAKGFIALVAAVFGYLYKSINELVVVLMLFILMDYILGILEAFKTQKKFDKWVAFWGILKKLLYGFLLIVAFLVDYIIIYFSTKIGIKLPVASLFGIAALAYLLGTEGFSIIKHFLVIGVPAPPFLLKFFGLLKDEAGKIVPIKSEQTDNDEEGLF